MAGLEAARLLVRVAGDASGALRAMDQADDRLTAFASTAAMMGAKLTAGITLPLAAMGGAALKGAADYETGLNIFQAVTGATVEQMASVANQAKALGADLSLPATSAGDATVAMVELAKAGLSVDDVLSASKGTMQLAAAGALSEAEAAKIAAAALNSFGLQGERMGFITDMFAAAANASAVEVRDLGDSLKMAGSVFSAYQAPVVGAEQSLADLTTAIAVLGNAGIRGSDAGTSLKQMILQLTGPSKAAKALMQELAQSIGLSGDIAFDAQGKMRSMPDIVKIMAQATKNMTDEARSFAVTQIFGADASRAIIALMSAQSEEAKALGRDWDSMAAKVTTAGAANELASARMKGLGGAFQGLQSQLETFGLVVAEPFLGPLAQGVQAVSAFVGQLGELPRPLIDAGVAFGVVLAAAGPMTLVVAGLTAALGFLISPLGLVTVGVAALAAAFASDFGGIRTATMPIIDEMVSGFKQLAESIANFQANEGLSTLDAVLQGLAVRIGEVFGPEVQAVFEHFTTIVGDAFATVSAAVTSALEQLVPFVTEQLGFITTWVDDNLPLMAATFQRVLDLISHVWNASWQKLSGIVQAVWPVVKAVVDGALKTILDVIKLGMQLVTGDWEGAWETFKTIVGRVWDGILLVLNKGLDAIEAVLRDIVMIVGNVAQAVWGKAQEIGSNIVAGLIAGINGAIDGVRAAVGNLANAVLETARDALGVHSASEEMAEIGEFTAEGMAVGIRRGQAKGVAAVNIFMQELVANTSNYAAEFGKAGGSLASAFDVAVTQGTEQTVRGLARNLDKFISDLRTAGVPQWRDIGDELAAAIASGLNDPTDGPVAVIHSIIADATAAMAMMKTPGSILDRLLGERQSLAEARNAFGNAGADAWLAFNSAIISGSERDLVKMLDSIGKVTDAMRTGGVADWAATGEAMVQAATEAARAQTEEDRSFWTDELSSLIAGGMQEVAANIEAAKKPARTALDSFTTAMSEGLRDSQMVEQFGVAGAQAMENLISFLEKPDNNVATKFANSIQKLFSDAAKAGVKGLGQAAADIETIGGLIVGGDRSPELQAQAEAIIASVYAAMGDARVQAAAKKAAQTNSDAIFDLTKGMTDSLRMNLSPDKGGGLVNEFLFAVRGAAAGGAEDITGFRKYSEMVLQAITKGMDPTKAIAVADQFNAAVQDTLRDGDTSGLAEWLKQFNTQLANGMKQIQVTTNFGIAQAMSGWNDYLKAVHFQDGRVTQTQGAWAGHSWATATIGNRPPAQVGPFGQVFAGGAPLPPQSPTLIQQNNYAGAVIVGNDGIQQLTREQERIGMQAAQTQAFVSGHAE